MKTTINKNEIKPCNLSNIKTAGKEFKAAYTDGDLLRAYQDQTGDYANYGEVLRATVELFEYWDGRAGYLVELLTWNGCNFARISFFTDALLNVTTDPLLITADRYTLKI